jgi:hypothetical protein
MHPVIANLISLQRVLRLPILVSVVFDLYSNKLLPVFGNLSEHTFIEEFIIVQ